MGIRFGPFTLDLGARQLLRGPEVIRLSPKAFELLALLVERHPNAVSKRELHTGLWRGTFVSEVNLAVLVTEVRAALGDSPREPQFIRTVHRFGYAFCGATDRVVTNPPLAQSVGCWLAWREQRVLLRAGENVLGRDPTADVCVDAVGVSRRHAMIVVEGEAVTLHDLDSKNGTYTDDVRVESPVGLVDGVEIRLGPATLRFHQLATVTSTQTLTMTRHNRSDQ
jgi:DNA-binding winged helix-turn-helix (wHTH) protein